MVPTNLSAPLEPFSSFLSSSFFSSFLLNPACKAARLGVAGLRRQFRYMDLSWNVWRIGMRLLCTSRAVTCWWRWKKKKFTLPHTAANFVCIEQLSIIINNDLMAMQSSALLKEEVFTFYNSFKRKWNKYNSELIVLSYIYFICVWNCCRKSSLTSTLGLISLTHLTKNVSHLFVKIGFFYRINMALKRGQIDSELFGLRITECNLIKGKNEHLLWNTSQTKQKIVRFSNWYESPHKNHPFYFCQLLTSLLTLTWVFVSHLVTFSINVKSNKWFLNLQSNVKTKLNSLLTR